MKKSITVGLLVLLVSTPTIASKTNSGHSFLLGSEALGGLYALKRTFEVRLDLCEKVYELTSKYRGRCRVTDPLLQSAVAELKASGGTEVVELREIVRGKEMSVVIRGLTGGFEVTSSWYDTISDSGGAPLFKEIAPVLKRLITDKLQQNRVVVYVHSPRSQD